MEIKATDPKGAAGAAKPQLQLIPPVLNTETAKALANGNGKYGPWNWRSTMVELMTYVGAIKRHTDAVLNREDTDPESGADHLGHIAACCGIILDARQNGTLVDNRPPRNYPDNMTPETPPNLVELIEQVRRDSEARLSAASANHKFARPIDGMILESVMSVIKANTVITTSQITAVEKALASLFEPS